MKNVVSMEAAAERLEIPLSVIKYARSKDADGINANSTVNVEVFKVWYDDHKDELEDAYPESLEALKIEEKKRNIRLKDLEIKEKERALIEPEEVKQLLIEIATAQSAVLKRIRMELAPKVAGKDEASAQVEINKAIDEVFRVLMSRKEEWEEYGNRD